MDDNCRTSSCGTRRVHLRPPRGRGGPKLARKSPQQFLKQSWILNGFQIVQGHRGVKNNDFSKKYFRHQSGRHWPDLDDRRYFGVQQLILGGTFWAHSCPRGGANKSWKNKLFGQSLIFANPLYARMPSMRATLELPLVWPWGHLGAMSGSPSGSPGSRQRGPLRARLPPSRMADAAASWTRGPLEGVPQRDPPKRPFTGRWQTH